MFLSALEHLIVLLPVLFAWIFPWKVSSFVLQAPCTLAVQRMPQDQFACRSPSIRCLLLLLQLIVALDKKWYSN